MSFLKQRGGKAGCLGCAVALVLGLAVVACVGTVFVGVFSAIRNSEPFEMAVQAVQENKTAVSMLGEPIEVGWFVAGSIETSGASGEADLSLPVSGPRGSGTLYVEADKSVGAWQLNQLVLEVDGERVSLLGAR